MRFPASCGIAEGGRTGGRAQRAEAGSKKGGARGEWRRYCWRLAVAGDCTPDYLHGFPASLITELLNLKRLNATLSSLSLFLIVSLSLLRTAGPGCAALLCFVSRFWLFAFCRAIFL